TRTVSGETPQMVVVIEDVDEPSGVPVEPATETVAPLGALTRTTTVPSASGVTVRCTAARGRAKEPRHAATTAPCQGEVTSSASRDSAVESGWKLGSTISH